MEKLLDIDLSLLESMKVIDWGYITTSTPESWDHYEKWVEKDYHGPLKYMADERKDLRANLNNFYPEFKSALVFLFDYTSTAKKNIKDQNFKFAAYTKGFDGIDYHYWIKDKLDKIAQELNLKSYKLSIDAQPVLERDLAYRAGLGWFGKNSMLISRKKGSFFLISSILLDQELNLSNKSLETDHCGNCTRCIDACPTDAIVSDRVIDANKCISTFTIELFKEANPPQGYPTPRGEIFGCDICQEVCPWNSKPLKNSDLDNSDIKFEKLFNQTDLKQISNREFKRLFKGTSLERTGRIGLLKNLISE